MLAAVLFGTVADIAEPAIYLLAMAGFAIVALLMILVSRHRQAMWERSFHILPTEPETANTTRVNPAAPATVPAWSAQRLGDVADLPPSLPAGRTRPA